MGFFLHIIRFRWTVWFVKSHRMQTLFRKERMKMIRSDWGYLHGVLTRKHNVFVEATDLSQFLIQSCYLHVSPT